MKCIMGLYDEFIVKMACGFYHMIALTEENELYGWGSNNNG